MFAYKQNQFISIKLPQKSKGKSIFHLKLNSQGDLFFNNLVGQLFRLKNNRVEIFNEIPTYKVGKHFKYYFTERNEIILVTQKTVQVLSDTITDINIDSILGPNYTIVSSNQDMDGSIYLKVSLKKSHYLFLVQLNKNNRVSHSQIKIPKGEFLQEKNNKFVTFFFKLNSDIFLYSRRGFFYSSNKAIRFDKPNPNEDIKRISNTIFLSTNTKKGINEYTFQRDSLFYSKRFFTNEFISSVFLDSNGTLFLGTFNSGIKVIPDYNKTVSFTKDELFSSLAVSETNEAIVSTRSGKLLKFENNHMVKIHESDGHIDKVFFKQRENYSENLLNSLRFSKQSDANIDIKDFDYINEEEYLFSSSNNIYFKRKTNSTLERKSSELRKNNPLLSIYKHPTFPERLKAVEWSEVCNGLIVGSVSSTTLSNWLSEKVDTLTYLGQNFVSRYIYEDTIEIYFGTEKNGVLVYNKGEIYQILSKANGLLSNTVKKVIKQNDILFVLSSEGIQLYDLNSKTFIGFGISEGVFFDKVKDFGLSLDKLWLMEKNALYNLELSSLVNQQNKIGQLFLDSVLVNDNRLKNIDSNINLDYTQNRLEFFFDYRDVLTTDETKLYYQLEGFKTGWIPIKKATNNLVFLSLPIGEYNFSLKAVYRNKEIEITPFHFEIYPPIWQRGWFYVLTFVLGASIIFILAYLRIRNLKLKVKQFLEKERLSKTVAENKLKALKSQMNPHFIFNALNSIQALVLRGDIDKSYQYINEFSSLVRRTLNYSNHDFIEWESELKLIEIYLSLEKLRFRDEFEYQIISPNDSEFSVPPMLIQPFIENALLHGLMHREGLKKLNIECIKKPSFLECTITDNGIGRTESKKIKERQNSNHKSFAISSIETRLDIFKTTYKIPVGFEYEDLYDGDEAVGTKVTVKIPTLETQY